ncbi:glycoside hydrolase family 3 C-terminal domain-containing protein [Actinomadura alba]|uniref:Glycoside hydrolase family 3 C-terminal domain-containing protein n=1 Tax=Actinomadura alba TaxID=406431 RepID=A0ABR7LM17_9ACTN|nr:glycoside hydrolase family 3 C-terminal domain-containing protein [Actinomadura alba]
MVVALLAALGLAAPASARETYPFQNPRLSLDARVNDLLGRLTLDEKISLLHQYQPAIPRLGIAPFKTGTEALHGIAWSTDRNSTPPGNVVTATSTVFPQSVGLGATWDPALMRRVGSVVGTEARGFNAENPQVWGLQLWAPVVNLLRDPRWGRNEEGYSEDPYLTGEISTAYGRGIQGDDAKYLRAAPVLKHYLANNNEILRDRTSSSLRPRVKKEYDEPAFKAAISADAATGVMMAYNLINGRPATAHADANDVIRTWTDKELFNVTDAGGPNNLVRSQEYYSTLAEGNAATLKAGVESFTVDDTNSSPTIDSIRAALSQGLLAQSDIDTAVRRILSIRFRLGEFDPDGGPYAKITKSVVDSPEHRRLAREAAGKAAVLLKNQGGALPLDAAEDKKIAVVGPLSQTLYTDWYSGRLPYKVTPLDGVKERLGAGGTVTSSEAVDRVALKDVETGRYVTAPGGAGGPLTATATSSGASQGLDVFDWGQGVFTLRSAANGKVVGRTDYSPESTFSNTQDQPNGWFVQQMFKFEDAGDGEYVIRYAGYETPNDWEGPNNYVTVRDDGTLILGAATAEHATRFAKETVSTGVDEAVKAATGADAAVVVVGSMPFINGREDHDRTDMNLAEGQQEIVKAVRRANPNTIVVLENSYPTTINWEQANVPAILWTSHAGAETGHAIADVLFGDVNPSGRLPQTWYRSASDLPDILEYDIIKADRTYQYFRGDPLYAFGHGLSYTTFAYGRPRLSSGSVARNGEVTVSVDVTNTGTAAGAEVVQLYTHQKTSRDEQPLKRLRGFQRVHLQPGERRTVRMTLRAADLAHWDVTRDKWVVESAEHDLMLGASSADIRGRATLKVRGETIPPRDLGKETRAVNFDDQRGIELVDESKARGDSVGRTDAGDWIKFADADLSRAPKRFTARVAKAGAGDTSIQIRLGGPTGRLAGTVNVPSTGDPYAYRDVTAAVTGAAGRQDVYLVFGGDLRLSSFALTG